MWKFWKNWTTYLVLETHLPASRVPVIVVVAVRCHGGGCEMLGGRLLRPGEAQWRGNKVVKFKLSTKFLNSEVVMWPSTITVRTLYYFNNFNHHHYDSSNHCKNDDNVHHHHHIYLLTRVSVSTSPCHHYHHQLGLESRDTARLEHQVRFFFLNPLLIH